MMAVKSIHSIVGGDDLKKHVPFPVSPFGRAMLRTLEIYGEETFFNFRLTRPPVFLCYKNLCGGMTTITARTQEGYWTRCQHCGFVRLRKDKKNEINH